jgi:HAD superfamily hydrolase (TIGR01509 family)
MLIPLPPGPFRAYLFDCDGTIADSMPLHYIAWSQALAEHNCPFPELLFYSWGGMPADQAIETLNRQHHLAMPIQQVADRKESLYYDLLPQLQPVPEVLEHIQRMHGQIPFAVVSGSTNESVVKSLETLNLLHLFDTLICAGDYTHPKPHPEPYLLAAQRLGVPPAACLVFEDTDLGIQSATAAGMASIKIPQPHERPKPTP